MIGWIILWAFLGLLALIGILLCFSIRANIEYSGDFSVRVKYLFITIYNSKSPKKKKRPKKTDKTKKVRKNQKSKKSKKSLADKIKEDTGIDKVADDIKKGNKSGFDFEVIKLTYDSLKSPVKRLIQKLKVENLRLNFVIGGEDAARTALSYGLQSAATSAFLSWINEIVKLKVKEVNITADFMKEESDLKMKCRMKLKAVTVVRFLLKYVVNTAKNSKY